MDNKENNTPLSVEGAEENNRQITIETGVIKKFVWGWLQDKGVDTHDMQIGSLEFSDVFELIRVYSKNVTDKLKDSELTHRRIAVKCRDEIDFLRAENAKLIEALEYITSQTKRLTIDMPEVCYVNPLILDCMNEADQALKRKEVKDE